MPALRHSIFLAQYSLFVPIVSRGCESASDFSLRRHRCHEATTKNTIMLFLVKRRDLAANPSLPPRHQEHEGTAKNIIVHFFVKLSVLVSSWRKCKATISQVNTKG